jgi:type I restriction enzyme S subunit
MSDWKEYKLGEIIDVRDGTHDSPKQKDIGKPLVTSKHIKGGKIDLSTAYSISIDDFDKINRRSKVDKWDVLFSMIGTIGEMVIIKEEPDFAIKNVGLFKAKDEYTSMWIYYYLKSPKAQSEILSSLKGSTQQYISLTDLRNFPITYPPIKEGWEIVQILSSLDDKIELNNKINQELESLAQLLFKRWFVDFEFPNEDGKPYKSSGGEMVESELGEIPKGWSAEKLSQVTKLIRGISYRKPELVNEGEGTAFINLKCFSLNGTFRQDGIKYYNGKYKEEQILSSNDILVAVTDLTQDREIIGMPILWNGYITALPSLDTCIIRSENLEVKNYLYYEFKTKRYKSRIIEFANGSTVLHLSVKGLETYILPLPNESLLKKWSETVQPILEKIQCNINQNNELSKARDILLPKLITGELQIKEN